VDTSKADGKHCASWQFGSWGVVPRGKKLEAKSQVRVVRQLSATLGVVHIHDPWLMQGRFWSRQPSSEMLLSLLCHTHRRRWTVTHEISHAAAAQRRTSVATRACPRLLLPWLLPANRALLLAVRGNELKYKQSSAWRFESCPDEHRALQQCRRCHRCRSPCCGTSAGAAASILVEVLANKKG